jgi:general secretion pathway protein G
LPYVYPGATNGSTLRSDPKSVFNVPDAKLGSGGVTSVGLNAYMASVNPARYWNYRATLVPRPSSIILLGEIEPRNNDFVQPPDQSLGAGYPGFRRDKNTRALMAFCDGHVEALTADALRSTQPATTNPWFWW